MAGRWFPSLLSGDLGRCFQHLVGSHRFNRLGSNPEISRRNLGEMGRACWWCHSEVKAPGFSSSRLEYRYQISPRSRGSRNIIVIFSLANLNLSIFVEAMIRLRQLKHCGHWVSAGIVIEVYFLCKFIQAGKRLLYSEFTGNLFLGRHGSLPKKSTLGLFFKYRHPLDVGASLSTEYVSSHSVFLSISLINVF